MKFTNVIDALADGFYKYQSGNYLDAIQSFMQSIQLEPCNADAIHALGWTLFYTGYQRRENYNIGNSKLAIDLLSNYLSTNNDCCITVAVLFVCLQHTGASEEAKEVRDRYLASHPDDNDVDMLVTQLVAHPQDAMMIMKINDTIGLIFSNVEIISDYNNPATNNKDSNHDDIAEADNVNINNLIDPYNISSNDDSRTLIHEITSIKVDKMTIDALLDSKESSLRIAVLNFPLNKESLEELSVFLRNKAVILLEQNLVEYAIAALRESNYICPYQSESLNLLINSLYLQGVLNYQSEKIVEAEGIFRELLVLSNKNTDVATALAKVLFKKALTPFYSDHLWKRVQILRESVYLCPNDSSMLFSLSQSLFEIGLTEEAVEFARRLNLIEPDNPDYLGLLCVVLNANRNSNAVSNYIYRLMDIIKSNNISVNFIGGEIIRIFSEMLIQNKEFEKSIKLLSNISNPSVHPVIAQTSMADTFLAKGDIKNAVDHIRPFRNIAWPRTFVVASLSQFKMTLINTGSTITRYQINNSSAQKSLGISSIAYYGRFAHQISDYIAAYCYTNQSGLILETPEWVGHYFFELDDPLLPYGKYVTRKGQRRRLLQALMDSDPSIEGFDIWSPEPLGHSNSFGVTVLPYRYKNVVQTRLTPRKEWMPYLQPAIDKLNSLGKTVVAIHLRRGDRVTMNDITETTVYLNWLKKIWPTLDSPVLFIASDEIDVVKNDFLDYKPYSLIDLINPWEYIEAVVDKETKIL